MFLRLAMNRKHVKITLWFANHRNVRKKSQLFMYILSELNGHFKYFERETQNTKAYLNHVPASFQIATSTILVWSLVIESRGVLLECHSECF